MQVYEDDSLQYIDSERIRYITPTFNNPSKLEFDIQPNNSYSDLCQTRLKFMVDVPIELIPDSYFTSKLFEHLEVRCIYSIFVFKTLFRFKSITSRAPVNQQTRIIFLRIISRPNSITQKTTFKLLVVYRGYGVLTIWMRKN